MLGISAVLGIMGLFSFPLQSSLWTDTFSLVKVILCFLFLTRDRFALILCSRLGGFAPSKLYNFRKVSLGMKINPHHTSGIHLS